MLYQTFEPPPELAHCVRSFWVFEGSATETEPYIYRGYADGGTELIFHYRSIFDMLNPDGSTDAGFDAGLHAQTDTFMRCVVRSSFGIFGCYLYPFAVPLLFGCAATDVTGLMTPIDQLLGVRGSHLAERIFSARDVLQRIQILSRFISEQLSLQNRAIVPAMNAVRMLINSDPATDIDQLAAQYAMSRRTFERRFRECSGFSPRSYTRILRFQKSLKYFGSGQSLTQVAADCGYYDQSHFIADFKEFSGYSPKIYFSGSAEGSEYL
mgnify:CR=1 FL=1